MSLLIGINDQGKVIIETYVCTVCRRQACNDATHIGFVRAPVEVSSYPVDEEGQRTPRASR